MSANRNFFLYNSKVYPSGDPIVSAGNRGLRYGDGVFETMRLTNNKIPLLNLHLQRLSHGLQILHIESNHSLTQEKLTQSIQQLAHKNQHPSARVRVSVFRGSGGPFDPESHQPNILIETFSVSKAAALNSNGLVIDIFPDVRKSCDILANLKSSNYLPYLLAATYAKAHHLNESLVLNQYDRIADATISNIFWISQQTIYTTPLSEGPVAGVFREWMLQHFDIHEAPLDIDILLAADEVFLTNAVRGIRWVAGFRNKTYNRQITTSLHQETEARLRQ